MTRVYDGNVFETERRRTSILAQHPNAPVKTLRDILLSGKVVPSRARALMSVVGHSTDEPGLPAGRDRQRQNTRQAVLTLMADQRLDALVYATFDHPPIADSGRRHDPPVVDDATGPGNNRRLSPVLGFPAMTVPAGFTADGLPVGH